MATLCKSEHCAICRQFDWQVNQVAQAKDVGHKKRLYDQLPEWVRLGFVLGEIERRLDRTLCVEEVQMGVGMGKWPPGSGV